MKKLLQKRWKKAKAITLLLQPIPFIKMIAVSGSLAKNKIKPNSDIDFFVVIKSSRIWTSRFLIISLLKLLGQYRTEENIAGKICPNRYQTDQLLTINPQNLYHAKDYSQIVPLFEIEDTYKKFQKANQWMFKKLKTKNEKLKTTTKNLKLYNNFLFALIRKMGEKMLAGRLGDFLEEKLKNYQKKRILWDRRTYKTKARIIITDQVLCFHPEGK